MFWNQTAILYDLFENFYNGKVNHKLVEVVPAMMDSDDRVLECACGTGMISKGIAKKCKSKTCQYHGTECTSVALRELLRVCKKGGVSNNSRQDAMCDCSDYQDLKNIQKRYRKTLRSGENYDKGK